uniref:Uncharacterized protein n=2 Tax=Oryza sativa subsp. japonica TaxID=39947 RepID=Q7EZ70_ORYSJ|nr:hypothetical protein [Oryza sativa Japonica Group]BAC21506.1 hypothetical protein [Oryza sativa Japonica Group]
MPSRRRHADPGEEGPDPAIGAPDPPPPLHLAAVAAMDHAGRELRRLRPSRRGGRRYEEKKASPPPSLPAAGFAAGGLQRRRGGGREGEKAQAARVFRPRAARRESDAGGGLKKHMN